MVYKFHMPIQRNILVWLLMPAYGRKSELRKDVMLSTSSSGSPTVCLDAILSCQSTINSYYASKFILPVRKQYQQTTHMEETL
jgi:hypothetical protein